MWKREDDKDVAEGEVDLGGSPGKVQRTPWRVVELGWPFRKVWSCSHQQDLVLMRGWIQTALRRSRG